jgi:hypothetical protein
LIASESNPQTTGIEVPMAYCMRAAPTRCEVS